MSSLSRCTKPGPLVGGADFDVALALEPEELTDVELAEAVVLVDRLRCRLEAASAVVAGAFDGRSAWAGDGARNAAGWMAARTERSGRLCRVEVQLARALRAMPVVEEASRAGRLGREKVKALAWAAQQEGLGEAFAEAEAGLVGDVESASVAGAWRYLRRWVAHARARLGVNEPDGPEPADGVGGSKMTLAQGLEGRWFATLDLGPEDGEIVANAVDTLMDAWWREGVFTKDDGLTMPERRARAVVELITRGALCADSEVNARPLVLALIDVATLTRHPHLFGPGRHVTPDGDLRTPSQPGVDPVDAPDRGDEGEGHRSRAPRMGSDDRPVSLRLAELSRSGPVPAATIRRLACEGAVCPVVIGADGRPLAMGRSIRIASRAQRHALRVRDQHCVFAGCSVAAEHCIAHHLVPWEGGGATDLDNLALVCRYHHRLIHDQGYGLAGDGRGRFTTTRPDRSTITGTHTDIGPTHRAPVPLPC